MRKEIKKGEAWRRGYMLGFEAGAKDEREFILNILDGIDKADSEMLEKHLQPFGGGTKAIRFALKNRII